MSFGTRMAAFIERRAGTIVLAALVLWATAAVAASRLRLDTSLRALLPSDFASIEALDALDARLGSQSDLFVAIRSPSREANLRFGAALATELEARSDLRWVVFRQDRTWFEDRALLFADLDDLLQLRRRTIEEIRAHVRDEVYGDLLLDEVDTGGPETPGSAEASGLEGVRAEIDALRGRHEIDTRVPEYFEADEGRLVVVKARPTGPDTDVAFARRLTAEVLATADALEPTAFHPELSVTLEGSYAQHGARVGGLRDDVVAGSGAALAALVLVIGVYFRRARAVVLVLVPLLMATTGALAFAEVAFGRLNLVSAFIFAVLLGLGIDFSIHLLARWRDERRRGHARAGALAIAVGSTGRATAAGAATTALSFATLVFADFQGFSQFGVVAAVGIVLALLAALIVMPALLVLLDRVRPWTLPPPPAAHEPSTARPWHRALAAAVLGLGLAGAAVGGLRIGGLAFEYDLGALGPRPRPASTTVGYRDAVGKAQTVAPAVALTEDRAQTHEVQRLMDALLAMDAATVDHLAEYGRLPPPVPPARDDDDELDDWGEDDDPFGDDDLDDPEFVALAARAEARRFGSPAAIARLAAWPPDRLRTLHARLRDATSAYRFVPDDQADKLRVIEDIRRRIDAKRPHLAEAERRDLDEWARYLRVDRPFGVDDLPPWLRRQLEDADGELGRHVVISTGGSKADYHNARAIEDALTDLPTDRGPVRVAAEFFVIPDVVDAIAADGPLVMGLAALVLGVTALAVFRSALAALAVAATVAIALAWLAGVWSGLGWKVNLFNVIALPLLVGMGQDDAIHLLSRWRERRGREVGAALRETGAAIVVTTLTTCCGFAGILFADHRGLESLGWAAVLGMTACLVASVAVLPAALHLVSVRRSRSEPP